VNAAEDLGCLVRGNSALRPVHLARSSEKRLSKTESIRIKTKTTIALFFLAKIIGKDI
jgi:hypothetical protein